MTSNIEPTNSTVKRIADLEQEIHELKHLVLQERHRTGSILVPISTLMVRVKNYLFAQEMMEPMSDIAVLPAFVECILRSDLGAVTLLNTTELLAAGECDLLEQSMSELPPGAEDALSQ
jgi:hypothetical protein